MISFPAMGTLIEEAGPQSPTRPDAAMQAISGQLPPSELDTLRAKLGVAPESQPGMVDAIQRAIVLTLSQEVRDSIAMQEDRRLASQPGSSAPVDPSVIYQALPGQLQPQPQDLTQAYMNPNQKGQP